MKLPPPRPRPKFAGWRYERNLNLVRTASLIEQAAAAVGLAVTCSDETVRLMCLPFDDERRRVPGDELLRAIEHLTDGEIQRGDFYPLRQVA